MKLTPAVSGLARSGATRSGYPVLQGAKVPLYALSGVARSGATRSNYVGSRTFINIGGIDFGSGAVGDGVGILAETLTKSDAINNTPVTLAFTARGWVPVEGTEVVITLGSKHNLRREFGGTILRTRHRYVGDKPVAENMLYDVSCIDYTWALDRRKVSGNYTNASVAAIAASLLTFAPAGYTLRVDPDIGAEILDQITFTEQVLSSAFTQLVKRVGGDFLCDFAKVVHLFYENTALSSPRIVNVVHPTLATISFDRDLSQVATRVLGSFGGSNALAQITPGDIFLPVETTAWYLPQGGTVLVGQQRVTYSGLDGGGRGSLVGPGAAPTSMPNAALQPGAGVDVGSHDYAVTYQTAQGESIPGPRLTVPVGSFLPPTTAPTVGSPVLPGAGPDQGAHDYAVSFIIATGETLPGPRVVGSTTLLADPLSGPTPDAVNYGPGPDPGAHDYAVTFLAAGGGETLPGPIGAQVVTGGIPAPTNQLSLSVSNGPGPDPGEHFYAYTFVRPEGETTSSPGINITTGVTPPPTTAPGIGSLTVGSGPETGSHAYACTFVISGGGETTQGPVGTSVQNGQPGPPSPGPGTSPTCNQYPNSGNYGPAPGSGNVGDNVRYAVSCTSNPGGNTWTDESQLGPPSNSVQIQASLNGAPNQCQRDVAIPSVPAGVTGAKLYVSVNGYNFSFLMYVSPASLPRTITVNGVGSSGPSYPGPGSSAPANIINLINIPLGGANVTSRRLYRLSPAWASIPLLLTTIGNNTQTTYSDTTKNAGLGSNAPPVSTATAQTVRVSGIATAPSGSGVIARKLYRSILALGWRYLATINDNTTTSYTDTIPDSGLGAPGLPPGNTTTGGAQTVHLSGIPTAPGATGAGAWRVLYRRSGGAGLRMVGNIPNNSATTFTDTAPNASLGPAPPTVSAAVLHQIPLTKVPLGNELVTARKLYRTPANTGGGTLRLVATISDNTTDTFLDTVPDASLGAAALTVSTAQAAQVALTAIPLGAAAVTARKLYRTKAGATSLLLLVTLPDNTTTTFLDVYPDNQLPATSAPSSDTSGLQQPTGNVFAGSPTLICASVAGFRPTGGWAIVGSQGIRYSGLSGNQLLGIPTSGNGAITATISYNTTAVAAPMLTGIPPTGLGVIKYPVLKGDGVNLWIQVDNLDAQAAARAQLPGSDGIIEDEIQDGRLGYAEGLSRCLARLDLLSALDSDGKVGVIAVTFVCRDINCIAGATVTVNLGPPINLRGDFLIQRVGVAQFHVPNLHPTYTVEASSIRFSAEEMLRLLRQGAM